MRYITASNILSVAKQAFIGLYETGWSSEDPELWREEPITIVVKRSFNEEPVFFILKNGKFNYLFEYRSYFPYTSEKTIELEINHWQTEFIKKLRLNSLIDYFQGHPLSKRAIINLWDNGCRDPERAAPCLVYLLFRKRGQKLDVHAHLRANNVLFLLLMDMQALAGIQQIVADRLGLKRGDYFHCVDSLLFFKKDVSTIKKQYDFIKNSSTWKNI